MLKLQFKDRRRDAIWLVDRSFTIGQNPANSLMIEDNDIAGVHAEIINDKDQLSLHNRSKGTSLSVNNKAVKSKVDIKAGDIITIGNIDLELVDPKTSAKRPANSRASTDCWAICSNASWLEQNRFPVTSKVVVGRDPSCDITLPLEHLSREHVKFEVRSGQLFVKDLESSNGTFLNGKKVSESQLKTGDKVKIDVITFEIESPTNDPNKTIIRKVKPEKSNLSQPASNNKKPAPTTRSVIGENPGRSSAKKNIKKQLSAGGKQKWISGDNIHESPTKSRTGVILLAISAMLAIASIAIIASFYM